MEEKRVIEVDEYERRLIIDSLNDKRNALIEKGADTDHVDDVLLDVIDAPTRKQKRKCGKWRDSHDTVYRKPGKIRKRNRGK